MKRTLLPYTAFLSLVLVACSSTSHPSQTTKSNQATGQAVATRQGDNSSNTIAKAPAQSSASSSSATSLPEEPAKRLAIEPNPLLDEETANHLLVDRTEPNPPMDEETARRLLIVPESAQPAQPLTKGRKKLLPVAPQLQQVGNYCAPTTVSMMLASRGMSVDQFQLAREMGTAEPFGTHNRDAIRILNRHLFGYETPATGQAGYRLEMVTSASPAEVALFKQRLRQNIDDGYPMYYTFDCAHIYPGFRGEHNVIGIGYELTADGTDIAALYYLDPSPNVQDPTYGGLKRVTPEELLTAMLTCVEPNYGW